MNIILVISDTLRRDHIGAYGNGGMITPSLDQFAKESMVFDYCRNQSFPTVPTRADILTGLVNFIHLGWQPLPKDYPTLPELLAEQGYLTGAVVDTPFFLRDGYGYDRGFERFIPSLGQFFGTEAVLSRKERRYETDYCAPATFLMAERWLQTHYKEKFFLYVDTWDPHEPWDPPTWYTQRYLPDYDGRPAAMPVYAKYRDVGISKETLERSHACYKGEVTMVDRWFGRLMDTVDSLNLTEKTAVIFLSDHGHYFGEHGYFGKVDLWRKGDVPYAEVNLYRSPLYEEVTRVPLMMRLPKYKPRRFDSLVSLPDVTATILEVAGAKIPKTISSSSLTPLIDGDVKKIHDCVFSSIPLADEGEISKVVDGSEHMVKEPSPVTISTKDWSFLYTKEGWPSELYRIRSDPQQKKNVFESNKDVAKELHKAYVDFLRKEKTEASFLKSRVSL